MSLVAGEQAASRKRRRTPPPVAPQDEMFWYYGNDSSDEDGNVSTESYSKSYSYGAAAEGSTGRAASTEPEYIDLLDSDGNEEDLAAADLQDDADIDVIEILSSDLEDDEDDVLLIAETEVSSWAVDGNSSTLGSGCVQVQGGYSARLHVSSARTEAAYLL